MGTNTAKNVLYSVARKEMQTGDLLLWKKEKITSFFSLILVLYQKIFKATYIHVGMVVVLGDRRFILEATPPVVRLYPISMLDDFYWIKTNIANNPSHIDVLLKNIGKPYSIIDFFTGLLGIGGSSNDYYCSEQAAEFYRYIGYVQGEDIDNVGKTPDSIAEAVLKASGHMEPTYVNNDKGNLNHAV